MNVVVDRHVRSVERVLEIAGLAPTPAIEKAYRAYAAGGGSLDLSISFSPPLTSATPAGQSYADLLPYVSGTLTVNGVTQPLAMVATKPHPWPKWARQLSTIELVQRELAAHADTDARSRAAGQASADSALGSDTKAVAATSASAEAAVARPPGVEAAARTITPSSDARDQAVRGSGTITRYSELGHHIGQFFTIYQRGRAPMRVKIGSVTRQGVVMVRRMYRTGYLEKALDRASFVRAEP